MAAAGAGVLQLSTSGVLASGLRGRRWVVGQLRSGRTISLARTASKGGEGRARSLTCALGSSIGA
eukprot:4324290-Pleurochrysis_carterae.AAC.2